MRKGSERLQKKNPLFFEQAASSEFSLLSSLRGKCFNRLFFFSLAGTAVLRGKVAREKSITSELSVRRT